MIEEEKTEITIGSVIVDGLFQLLFSMWIVDICKDVFKYDVLYWPLWLGLTILVTAIYGCDRHTGAHFFVWQLLILGPLKIITLIIY